MAANLLLTHLTLLGILVLLVQSLNLAWRTRLLSLGHHGFFALGAYSSVVMMKLAFSGMDNWGLEGLSNRVDGLGVVTVCILSGALIAATVALIISGIFVRIRGDYFAVATLVFSEAIRSLAANWGYVGGGLGFEVPYLIFDKGKDGPLVYSIFYAGLLLVVNFLVFVAIVRLDKSVYGLYITAVENDPIAAEHSGIDVAKLQNMMFAISAAFAGAAGALFLHFTTLIVPNDFSFINGLPVILAVVLGRLATLRCVLATVFIYVIYEVLKLRFFGLFGNEWGDLIVGLKDALLGVILIFSATIPIALRRIYKRKSRPIS